MAEAMAVACVSICAVLVSGVAMASMVVPVTVVIVVVAMAAMPGRSRHKKTSLVTK
jgi:hypothetical protein